MPRFRRAIASLLVAFPIACFAIALADKPNFLGHLVYLVSPGYPLGSLATEHVSNFGNALSEDMSISLSVNEIYWSGILFGIFSLLAKSKKST
jgi:hypothetical protein